jgi:hypothetical protein
MRSTLRSDSCFLNSLWVKPAGRVCWKPDHLHDHLAPWQMTPNVGSSSSRRASHRRFTTRLHAVYRCHGCRQRRRCLLLSSLWRHQQRLAWFQGRDDSSVLASDMSRVEASQAIPYGQITSKWERERNELHLEVAVPQAVTARVVLPRPAHGTITVLADGHLIDASRIRATVRENEGPASEIALSLEAGR